MTAARAFWLLASYEFGLTCEAFAPPPGVDKAEWLEALTFTLRQLARQVAAKEMKLRLVPVPDDDDGRAA